MSFNRDIIIGLRERQRENRLPDHSRQYATWNGEDYPACAGGAMSQKELAIGGLMADADLILSFVTWDFVEGFQTSADLAGKIPVSKQSMIFNGKTYRVQDVKLGPGLAFIVIGLIDPTKGAHG